VAFTRPVDPDPVTSVFTPGTGWRLHPSVGLRPEPFGALAYHFGTRRLTFLKDPTLTEIVRMLGEHDDVDAAISASGAPPARHATYRAALARLAHAEVICER
jgi:putative mycofactocin binding protein MftB